MNANLNLEQRNCWIWWTCGTAFLIGMTMGWRTIRSQNERLPAPTSIPQFERDDLKLNHPLADDGTPAAVPGNLRIWLYSGRELGEPPLAVVVEPPAFDIDTPWLKGLISEKLDHSSSNFSLKMRGWITFSSPRTMVHLRSDNGYRIRFRNGFGEEQSLVHWVDDMTEDLAFGAVVEPGRYEIEIDYFNAENGGFFEIWASPQVEFEPAPDPHVAPR